MSFFCLYNYIVALTVCCTSIMQFVHTAKSKLRAYSFFSFFWNNLISPISGQTHTSGTNNLDAHLKAILEKVKLLYLLEREGRWDASQNWEDILSLGEQQRLGMVSSVTSVSGIWMSRWSMHAHMHISSVEISCSRRLGLATLLKRNHGRNVVPLNACCNAC